MLAHRSFTQSEIASFAELSGDYNPMHVDPVAARRTIFGECVVHGVFVLMWALDRYQANADSRQCWSKVAVRFIRPALVDWPVSLMVTGAPNGRVNLAITSDGRPILECDLCVSDDSTGAMQNSVVKDSLPPQEVPARPNLAENEELTGTLDLHYSHEHGKRLFPALTSSSSLLPLAVLLAASRIVGMRGPGEHSVFLQFNLGFSQAVTAHHPFGYRLIKYRKASQRLAVAIEGAGCEGILSAFVRPGPVAQPTMTVVKQEVTAGRFAGRRVLVVGGSRGLGEVAAKILAAGGAEVALTYRLGSNDADKIVADIQKHGGTATCFQLETASRGWEDSLSVHGPGFDHLCYFATPPIADGDGQTFAQPLYERFAAVYVSGFLGIAQWIARQTNGRFALFNASSAAVEAPPPRLLEYAAAKAASEACCRWLAGRYPQARIHIARFPRLLTDQLASDPALYGSESDSLKTVHAELTCWLAA